jgi:MFS family permease
MHALVSLNRDQRLLALSFLLWGVGMSLFFYIQPLYIAELGATPEQIGVVLSLSGLIVTVLYIPIGWWADRHGRKPVMIAGWSLGVAAALSMALAPDWRWIIPAQIAYWLANFAMPAANGYIAASTRKGHASRTFSVIWGSSSVGSILSPAVGGWIGDQFGFRTVYVCGAVMFGLSTVMVALLRDQPVEPQRPALASAPRRLLVNPAFVGQIALTLVLFFAIDLGQVMTPKFMQDVRGLSLTQIGWLGTIGAFGIMVFVLLLGQLPSSRPWALLASQMMALLAVGLWLWSPAIGVIGLAYFIHGSDRVVRPSVLGRLSRSLDGTTMSLGYGFYETALRLGLAISPYVAGLLYTQDPRWPLSASLAGLAASLVLTWLLPDPARQLQPALEASYTE